MQTSIVQKQVNAGQKVAQLGQARRIAAQHRQAAGAGAEDQLLKFGIWLAIAPLSVSAMV